MGEYPGYAALLEKETEGEDFRVRFREGRTGIAVMAIHGGGIEPGTTEIAEAVAGEDHAFYTFSGFKAGGNACLHITSRRFDEPRGVTLATTARIVLTLHGCRVREAVIYIGGRHLGLREKIREKLAAAGFRTAVNPRFTGTHPANICNRCRGGQGIQLEISAGMRRTLFVDLTRLRRKQRTPRFDTLAAALRQVLADA